jgi:molybdopterin synthase catalytic subunit
MAIRVQPEDFDVTSETKSLVAGNTSIGAVVTFTGLVRDMAGGETISAMTLEHYPEMTETMLAKIDIQANERWPLDASLIIHRYGRLEPGEQIVLVITASSHRQAAFEAAEFLMDWLKTKAPFWKQEATTAGEKWVAAKTSDDDATERWSETSPASPAKIAAVKV